MDAVMGILWAVVMMNIMPERWSDKKRFTVFTISMVVMALPLVLLGKLILKALCNA